MGRFVDELLPTFDIQANVPDDENEEFGDPRYVLAMVNQSSAV